MKNKPYLFIVICLLLVLLFFVVNNSYKKTDNIKEINIEASIDKTKINADDIVEDDCEIFTETKEECIERIKKEGGEKLVDNFFRLDNYESLYLDSGISIEDYARALLFKYFSCELDVEKNDIAFQNVKNYIKRAVLDDFQNKIMLNWLDDVYLGLSSGGLLGISNNLAIGDLSKICPLEIERACRKYGTMRSSSVNQDEVVSYCDNLCERMEQYDKENDKALGDIVNNEKWLDADQYSFINRHRVGVAYRFGGYKFANNFCNSLSEKEENICLKLLQSIAVHDSNSCNVISESLQELFCFEK